MTRVTRSPLGEPILSRHLRWHADQCLRRGSRCAVLVIRPLASDAGAPELSDLPPGPLAQIAARVKPVIRYTDVVEVEEHAGIGILLNDADAEGARAVQQRLSRVLTDRGPIHPARGTVIADLHVSIAYTAAEPVDLARLSLLVDDLVNASTVPDLRLAVPLVWPRRRRAGRNRRGNNPPGHRQQTHGERAQACGSLRLMPPDMWAMAPGEDREALRQKADALGVPFVALPAHLPASMRRVVNPELARTLGAVPIGRTRRVLTVAMRDPSCSSTVQQLAAATGLSIFPVLAAPCDLTRVLDQLAEAGTPRARRQSAQPPAL